jgi:hypothetical protein
MASKSDDNLIIALGGVAWWRCNTVRAGGVSRAWVLSLISNMTLSPQRTSYSLVYTSTNFYHTVSD